jgi:hypothetical protein
VAGGAVLLAQASAGSSFATGILPGLATIGLGVGMVFAPVAVTAMAGCELRRECPGVSASAASSGPRS